ncbi:MAG: FtsX-like permease family protein [Luteitalea sp.]|nr:FtsX-like permease family protein [Luteitalea sp.]
MRWWRRLLGRRRIEAELDAELRDHVERQVADYMRAGVTEPEARRRARLEFGGLEPVKEQCRDVRGTRVIQETVQDVRYACRVLRKSPGFMVAAVTSLALGIGANTAIFSLIDAVMLKSLPVREPDRLIELLTDRGGGKPFNAFSSQALVHFRDHQTTLDGVIASTNSRFFVGFDDAPLEMAKGQYVTGDFFPALSVPALLGRTIQPSDDRHGAARVAVLSYAYWQRRFGGDPGVLGRRMTLDDHAFTIVGVTAPAFRGTLVGQNVDVWIPLVAEPLLRKESWTASAGYKWLQLLGRVKAGRSFEQARAELETMFQTDVIEAELATLNDARPDHPARSWRLVVEPARTGLSMVRQQYAEPLLLLLAVSGIVLLIACVNVANLLLARASARRHEIAVRLSLGAARSRVVRQLLTESMLLASAGAALGIAFAYIGCRYLLDFFATGRTPITLEVQPDLRMLAFTATLAVATGLLFGLGPAWRATLQAQGASLMGSGRVHGRRDRRVLSRVLIGSQVALSVIMLVCAGLFLRSLFNLRSIDTGFDRDSVLLISTDASRSRLTPDAQRTTFRETLTRLGAMPGVHSASLTLHTPIEGGGTSLTFLLKGQDGTVREAQNVHVHWVSPDYFATLRTPIHSGRDFRWQDTVSGPNVAIINQAMARQHFGHQSPLGQHITLDAATYEIVAVVGDAKYLELRNVVPPTVYFNAFQQDDVSGQFAIRTAGGPLALAAAARATIRAAAPAVAITSVRTLTEQVDASIVRERMLGVLSGFFAALGLLLAAVGLYGVMAYMVTRRTSEIGIRMALGARPSRIAAMVMREAFVLTAAGVVVGSLAALLLSRSLASLLFGLTPTDPLTMSAVAIVMVATGLAAAYLPSRRAARLDPTVALRTE